MSIQRGVLAWAVEAKERVPRPGNDGLALSAQAVLGAMDHGTDLGMLGNSGRCWRDEQEREADLRLERVSVGSRDSLGR